MGYSIRTLGFRYTMWVKYDTSACRLLPTLLRDELYDHRIRTHDSSTSKLTHTGSGSGSGSVLSSFALASLALDPLSSDMELVNIAKNATLLKQFHIPKIRKSLFLFLHNSSFFNFPCPGRKDKQ